MSGEATIGIDDLPLLRRLCTFTSWVGSGRALTQTGRVKLADARELVTLLGTGDDFDPMGGRFRTTSSAELPGLSLIVAWATACGLVRVNRGRLVAVKKHASLLDRPTELWDRMFDTFPLLGDALCPDGWAESLLRREFSDVVNAVLLLTHRRGGTSAIADTCAVAWEIAAARYHLDAMTAQQLETCRRMNDRDLRYALRTLEGLGALRLEGDAMTLTEEATRAMRRATGEAGPGDAIAQLKVTLMGVTKPPVWRRLLVPANIRLDRLHDIIQAAMGWEDYHLHAFTAAGIDYGPPNPDLDDRDERATTLERLISKPGDRMRYTYDFGDGWEHEILVEELLIGETGMRYPACVGGKSRCPPEDCGGSWGYASLRETLADPDHEEHANMIEWLGLRTASEFDPAAFDVGEVNARL
jgi:hypothetical protein